MTSSVTVGRARSSFISTASLPRVEVEGALDVLVVGGDDALISLVRRIDPEPRIDAKSLEDVKAEGLASRHDVIVIGDDGGMREVEVRIEGMVGMAGSTPVVCVLEVPLERRVAVARALREHGVADLLVREEATPSLMRTVLVGAIERRRIEVELLSLRERFALAARGAFDGMWEWDAAENRVYYSRRWLELFGLHRGEIEPSFDGWMLRVHPADQKRLRAALAAHMEGRSGYFQAEHRFRDGQGNYRVVLARGLLQRDKDGTPVRMAGSMVDITPYREQALNVREESRRDAVTDLPREHVFHERLARAVELNRAYRDYGFAVLMVRVDRFSRIRDSFGRESTAEVLAAIAARIQGSVTEDEVVARYGEDRFAVLLENVEGPSAGTAAADRIHRALKQPIEVEGNRLYVTVSIGMTSSARDYTSVDELITDVSSAADHAREARRKGEAGHRLFDTSMRIEALTLLRLEIALRDAIEREEFSLHYQPIVALSTGKIVGFEALIRWESLTRGRVSPGEFIPVAEDTGLIVPIGRWAIRQAARQLKEWHDEFELAGRLSLSVNVSGRQILDPELVPTLQEALAATGVDRRSLKLELTESVLMENAGRATELIQQLRATGVQIYIDDFGTGYSSLSYLHRFPVDGLKIDKSFVDELDGSAQSGVMIRTILDMARNLGLDAVAEGIETEAQAAQLRELECVHGQGYLYAAALSPGDTYAAIARML